MSGPTGKLRLNKEIVSEMRFMVQHIDRKSNEIIFAKCMDPACQYCTKHPVRAKKMWEYLRQQKMKWANPVPSTLHPGHFMTFLEVCELNEKDLPTGR